MLAASVGRGGIDRCIVFIYSSIGPDKRKCLRVWDHIGLNISCTAAEFKLSYPLQ